MKTKRFDFNWKPLQLRITMAVEGSVPDKQNYNADTQEYTPDYRITPLLIQPCVSILDKDEVLPAGRVNHLLTNIRWYEIVSGRRTPIAGDDPNYEITTSGGFAGRIKVNKNAEPKIPITLEFYAEYIDSRNNQVNVIRGTYAINCSDAADLVRVELDAAEQTIYNPLKDERVQTVTATVWVGDRVCDPSKYQLIWEVLAGNVWRSVGADRILDSDIVEASGNVLKIDRWLMGRERAIRCRCKYSVAGTPGSVELTDATPYAEASFIRRIPKYESEIAGAPYNVPAGTMRLAPSAVIRDTNGEIPNADKELLPLWYIATNKQNGALSYSLVAHGMEPIIPTKKMDKLYGAVIGLDVKDLGPVGIAQDAQDNRVFTDADGALLIFH